MDGIKQENRFYSFFAAMNAKSKKSGKYYFLVIGIILLAGGLGWMYTLFFSPAVVTGASNEVAVYIKNEDDFTRVFAQLEEKGYLRHPLGFRWLSQLSKYTEKIRPGKYTLRHDMSNYDIVRLLRSGKQEEIKLAIKSHGQLSSILELTSKKLNMDMNRLQFMLDDTVVLQQYGMHKERLAVYFIPNTYFFYWNTEPSFFLEKIHGAYLRFWNEDRRAKAKAIGLDIEEVSILASIVDKETNRSDEMPMVAGLYLNRLESGMKLQADPTVKFALKNFELRRLYEKHILFESPYNTYHVSGLPPGPICVPSVQAIDAVLNRTKHNYVYMCAREDFSGYHTFAADYNTHLLNRKRYQMALNRRNIK